MKKIYYNWQQVRGACLDIARQMSNHYWRPDYIVGIGRGGLIPANLLSQYTGVKMNSLDISLRDGGDCVSNLGMAEDAYAGKKIISARIFHNTVFIKRFVNEINIECAFWA